MRNMVLAFALAALKIQAALDGLDMGALE